jgi:hypothetical protein
MVFCIIHLPDHTDQAIITKLTHLWIPTPYFLCSLTSVTGRKVSSLKLISVSPKQSLNVFLKREKAILHSPSPLTTPSHPRARLLREGSI